MVKKSFTISSSDKISLKGFVLRDTRSPGKRPVVLVLHGWTSSTRRFPERVAPLVAMGYVCVMFDMRGHGETGGDLSKYSRKDHLDDCTAVYDYIKNLENVDLNDISVLGSSYGSYLACLLTTQRNVNNLVLSSPAQYQDEMFSEPQLAQDEKERKRYRLQPHGPKDNKALKAFEDFLSDYTKNALIIEAEQDEQVPSQVPKDYAKVAGERAEHVVIEGADHSFYNPSTNEQMISTLQEWFSELRNDRITGKFHKEYPGKAVIEKPAFFPTEYLCEIEPTEAHPEYSKALAIIDKSEPHYHKETTEYYKVLAGTLNVYLDGELTTLEEGDEIEIKPGVVHYAEGHETLVEVMARPGWVREDHILVA